jgi:hypothetical protein
LILAGQDYILGWLDSSSYDLPSLIREVPISSCDSNASLSLGDVK